jgi:hypothetical protein
VLKYVSGSRSGIVEVCQRHDWEPGQASAFRPWAAHLIFITAQEFRERNPGPSSCRSS